MGHTKWQKREKTKGALEFRLQKLYETFARSAWWTAARNDPTVCPFAMKTVQVVWTGGQLFCFNWIYKSGMFHSKSKQPHDTFLKFLYTSMGDKRCLFFCGGVVPLKNQQTWAEISMVRMTFKSLIVDLPGSSFMFFHLAWHFPTLNTAFFRCFSRQPMANVAGLRWHFLGNRNGPPLALKNTSNSERESQK